MKSASLHPRPPTHAAKFFESSNIQHTHTQPQYVATKKVNVAHPPTQPPASRVEQYPTHTNKPLTGDTMSPSRKHSKATIQKFVEETSQMWTYIPRLTTEEIEKYFTNENLNNRLHTNINFPRKFLQGCIEYVFIQYAIFIDIPFLSRKEVHNEKHQ